VTYSSRYADPDQILIQPKSVKFVPPPPLICVELNPGPPKKTVEEIDRWRTVIYSNDLKMKQTAIAKKVGITQGEVSKILSKHKRTGSVKDAPGRGRKRKLSDADEKKL
jgi:hypothetical protein